MSLIKTMREGTLKVKIYEDRKSMGKAAALECAAKMKELLSVKPEINMIFAAAPSQNEFLEGLLENDEIEWHRINAFHMDEYIGLNPEAPQGFGNFLKDRLFGKRPFQAVHYLGGNTQKPEEECRRYGELLTQYPTDIVCMGIGENGHIAFNDPHVAFFNDPEQVKVVELDEKCRNQQVNDGCFRNLAEVPTRALTLTIPALVAAAHVFCMVPGKTKTEAVTNTVKGDITEQCPASILKRHGDATLYTDRDSGAGIL